LSDSLKFKNTAIALVAVLVLEALYIFNSVYATNNMPRETINPHIVSQNHSNGHIGIDVSSSLDIEESSFQPSPYSGEELRDVKSLSDSDIQSLLNGTGEAFGGIAKLAELNGYPGPRHVLDITSDLKLTDNQKVEIEMIYESMSRKAKAIGAKIIAIERDMDKAFANKTITEQGLKLLINNSADLYGQIRFVHLSAHIDTVRVLTAEQVQMYNKIRGYDTSGIRNIITSENNYDSNSSDIRQQHSFH
jgi:hypothetical protein